MLAASCAVGGEFHHDDDHDHDHGDEATELFERAYEELHSGKADQHGCSGVQLPDRSGFNNQVALTFDDGPNLATTPDVVAVLRQYDIPATFFINGDRVSSPAAEDLVADLADDPLFRVGNHSWSHRQMTSLSSAEVAREIDDTAEVITQLGDDARYFRFPFGASTCSTAEAVRERGAEVTGWHVDSADWCFAGGTPGHCSQSQFAHVDDAFRNDMVGYTVSQVQNRGGGVVLFHDVHRYTADNIERTILELEGRGYDFVGIDDTSVFPKLNEAFAGPGDDDGGAGGGDPGEGGDDEGEDDGDDEGDDSGVSATVSGTGGAGLWLRDGPSTDAARITGILEGESVYVLDGPEGSWYQVRHDGQVGWVHGDYLAF